MKILSIKIRREVDPGPDLSYLGEYHGANKVKPQSIDRMERGDMGRNEYRFFTPALTAEQTGNPDSPEEDYQCLEAYNRGDWCMLGIWAEAEVQTQNHGVIQTIRSGGLWGIESDSGEVYLDEIANEELAALSSELGALGFTKRQIKTAIAKAKEVKA